MLGRSVGLPLGSLINEMLTQMIHDPGELAWPAWRYHGVHLSDAPPIPSYELRSHGPRR